MCSQSIEKTSQVIDMSECEMNLPNENTPETSEGGEESSKTPYDDNELLEPLAHSENPEGDLEPKGKEARDPNHELFTAFMKQFQEGNDPDTKLQLAIDFMEHSLSSGGTPSFRYFWEARRLCLPLFKENVSQAVRAHLWNRYSDLSKEARRLKDLLDEQSAFAVEQIEMAIQALEKNIEQFAEEIEKSPASLGLPFPQALGSKQGFYEGIQRQLNILNAQAARINALRKELLKTEMRVRQKNKFFQRLSAAGDKVFPKRKELIKDISTQFIEDVESFIKDHFNENLNHEHALYILREDIKTLQGLAKGLTLNTSSFTQTRLRLSECWDQIKTKEKERKKERAQQKATVKQNMEEIEAKIIAFKDEFDKGSLSIDQANKMIDDIVAVMRQTQLGRDEVKALRGQLAEAKKPLLEKIKEQDAARLHQEDEKNRQKREKFLQLREHVEGLLNRHGKLRADELSCERETLLSQIQESGISKNEKQELERLLKPLKDIITEKEEQALLELSEDDRQNLKQLQDVLQQRKTRRQDIKNQLEILRKTAGSSALDFEKAMSCNAQIQEEKERLDKANQGVKEIEVKIAQLQSKLRSCPPRN